jgi:membrane protease YdiL (CAAX protease family)
MDIYDPRNDFDKNKELQFNRGLQFSISLDQIKDNLSKSVPTKDSIKKSLVHGFDVFCMDLCISIPIIYLSSKLVGTPEQWAAPQFNEEPGLFDVCIRAPIMEEIVYRGILEKVAAEAVENSGLLSNNVQQRNKQRTYSARILTSLIFGLAHYRPHCPYGPVLSAFIGGLNYSWAAQNCGLLTSIFSHMIHNTMGSVAVRMKT